MTHENITTALRGKVITFDTLRPFAIEKVHSYDTFIIVSGNGNAVPIGNEYLPTLIKYGAVEVSQRNAQDSDELINVTIQ